MGNSTTNGFQEEEIFENDVEDNPFSNDNRTDFKY
jgi:hypothetical protein